MSEDDARPVVHVIDDDASVRWGLELLLRSSEFEVVTHAAAEDFLAWIKSHSSSPVSCVLCDVKMPGLDGIELVTQARAQVPDWPMIMMTGQADVSMAVRSMKTGAFDFIEKPFDSDHLLSVVAAAFQHAHRKRLRIVEALDAQRRIAQLKQRERAVLDLAMQGKPSKVIAYELGLSIRTVELYRSSLIATLSVHSLAEAVRLVTLASLVAEEEDSSR